jgi:hypothetical protein
MLSFESMIKIKEGKDLEIPENELELAKEWVAKLKASQDKKEVKKDIKKETVLKDKELEDNGEN